MQARGAGHGKQGTVLTCSLAPSCRAGGMSTAQTYNYGGVALLTRPGAEKRAVLCPFGYEPDGDRGRQDPPHVSAREEDRGWDPQYTAVALVGVAVWSLLGQRF